MRFKDWLNEKWVKTVTVRKNQFDIYVNPTRNEVKELIKIAKDVVTAFFEQGIDNIRWGIEDKSNPKIYAWVGEMGHQEAKDHIKFDMGFVQETRNGLVSFEYKVSNLKNKDKVFATIRRYIPKAKTIEDREGKVYDLYTGKRMVIK